MPGSAWAAGGNRLIWRVVVIASALIYAAVALMSGADRIARTDARFAAVVPGPFRANADVLFAQAALARQNYKAMEQAGAGAVRRDPLGTSSAALYGWALFAQGNDAGATAAFRVAGQLGWRDPLTQVYWFAAAIQQRDYPVAAQRIDALLRQNPEDRQRDAVIYQLESVPEGRKALVERMKERPGWISAYASDLPPLPPQMVKARFQTLLLLGQSGTRLGCAGIAKYVQRLVDARMMPQAQLLRDAHCGQPAGVQVAGQLLSDGGFEDVSGDRPLTPFDWDIAADGSLDLALGEVSGNAGGMTGKNVAVSNSGAITRAFANQLLAVGAGRYRLSGLIAADAPDALRHFGVALACSGGVRDQLRGIAIADGRFTVPVFIAADCRDPRLMLTIAPGAGRITIDSLALVRL